MNEEEKNNIADGAAKDIEGATIAVAAVEKVLPPPSSSPPPPSSTKDGDNAAEGSGGTTTTATTATTATTTNTTTPNRREGRRERKSTTATYVPDESFAAKKEVVIPDGSGMKLSEMQNVVENFKATTWSDPNLRKLYGIVFGVGKKKEFKNHLLQFNGLVYNNNNTPTTTTTKTTTPTTTPTKKDDKDDNDNDNGIDVDDTLERNRDMYKLKMYKLKLDELKNVMDLCDIDRSADSFIGDDKKSVKQQQPDKEMLCIRFMEWLEHPKENSSGKAQNKKKKRKSSSTATTTTTPKKRKSSSTTTTTTTPSASSKKKKKMSPSSTKKAAKKVTTPTSKTTSTASTTAKKVDEKWNIPGVSIEKVREKVKGIITNGDKETLTVKTVRKTLEDWLDIDLSTYKDTIRSLAMEFL